MNEDRQFNITVTSGTIIRVVLFLILFSLLFYIRDLVLVVLAAIVIASSVEPLTQWFIKKKFKRLPAVVIIYLCLALILAGFFIFALPSLLNEAVVYLNSLPENIRVSDLWSPIKETGMFETTSMSVTNFANQSFSIHELVNGFKEVIAGTGEGIIKTASVVFGGLLSFILIIVLSFYLSAQEDGVSDFLRIITPVPQHDYIVDLWKRSQVKIGYWMQGQLLLAVVVGILIYQVLAVFGIKHALLLAVFAAVCELIPIFGPIIAAIPALIIATTDTGVATTFLVAGWYLNVHQIENHLLYPVVVKKIVGVSPIIVILALVIGAKLAGFLGAVLAVPLSAVLMEYIHDIERRRGHHHMHNS